MNKRGLSAIITTLLVVLLVLVAVGIVWGVVGNIIREGAESVDLGKLTLRADITAASIDNSSNNVAVTVERNPGKGELTGIKFVFYDGVNSEVVTRTTTLEELGSETFVLHLADLVVDNLLTISIVPVFKSSTGKELFGNVINIYDFARKNCVADCTGKICGTDGCWGTCSPGCGVGEYCSNEGTTCELGNNPCTFTSAEWSYTEVVEGTVVGMGVSGTDCEGIDINFTVYENDVWPLTDEIFASDIVTVLNSTWIAMWEDDNPLPFITGDPEYYFIATVVDNPSENIQSFDLTVTQITCNYNNITEGAEFCDGTDVGSRTCQDEGFDSGTLVCLNDCLGYDTSVCSVASCTPVTNPCGSAVCGDVQNGTCGEVSCGNCGGGESCVGGVCVVQTGNVWYLDPVNGDTVTGDGSFGNPWGTLEELFVNGMIEKWYGARPYFLGDPVSPSNPSAPVKPGDTIYLRSGYHGVIGPGRGYDSYGYYNPEPIIIRAQEEHTPTLGYVDMDSVSNWYFIGITMSPSFQPGWSIDTSVPSSIFGVHDHGYNGPSYNFYIEDCMFFTDTYSNIDQNLDSWVINVWDGPYVSLNTTMINNIIKNVRNGIHHGNEADNVVLKENLIENFGADGIHHGVTSNWIIESNTVKNFRRNSNFDQHADGIQCEIPCDNTTIRNNIFIHFDYSDNDWGFTGPIGSTTPNPNNLFDEHQGIFGTYPNSIIENNLVLVSHVANGIRANGENLQVINNILIDPTQREQPGIILLPAYGGEIIRNNIANVITVDASMTEDHNIDLRDYSQNYSLFFADFANYDFHHSSGSPAIDVGSSDLAPFYDIEGTFRPQGSDWDLGPYEYIA